MSHEATSIAWALKEWPVICDLLISGRQQVIYRKGGIAETLDPDTGTRPFKPIPETFLLLPSYFHQQDASDLKSHWLTDVNQTQATDSVPDTVSVLAWAKITEQHRVTDLQDLFSDFQTHAYCGDLLIRRWFYKPDHPLWRLTLQVTKFSQPHRVINREAYQKCRSWFELEPGDRWAGAARDS